MLHRVSPARVLPTSRGNLCQKDGKVLGNYASPVSMPSLPHGGGTDAVHACLSWCQLPAEPLCGAGPVYKYDLSIPVAEMYSLVEETRERMAGLPVEVVGYGHLGDGNLHLNVSCQRYDEEILKHIEPFVYEWTAARKGSISAEHGLGQMKADCIGWASLLTASDRARCQPPCLW